eukprot:m.95454 g.95454  ORF g.95454 m.95454 type:complete len:288 (-) comp8601_c0_seq1:9-872(-)
MRCVPSLPARRTVSVSTSSTARTTRRRSRSCTLMISDMQVMTSHPELQKWAESRNPSGEQSTSMQSCLIRPVQRILKYPLFLKELSALVADDNARAARVSEAMKTVVGAANHINEMTRLCETFTAELASAIPGFRLTLHIGTIGAHGEVLFWTVEKGRPRREQSGYLIVLPDTIFLLEARKDTRRRGGLAYKLVASVLSETADMAEAVDVDSGERTLCLTLREAPVLLEDGTADISRVFTLKCSSLDDRSRFLRAVQLAAANRRAVLQQSPRAMPMSPGMRTSLVEV